MSKQDMLKVQTCVLRVNIHCEGCMHKVKKKLQKVEGVYKVSIDAEQGKVMVSGNADPASLIEKLEKAGKHAELWGPQKGAGPMPFPISHEQLKKFQIENFNKNNQKKGNDQQQQHLVMKNGFVQLPFKKGGEKNPAKDHKAVRFELPEDEDEDDDDYDDDFDEFDDEEDDGFEDEFGEGGGDVPSKPLVKGGVVGQKPSKAAGNPHKGKGDKGGGKEGKAKKGGGGIDMFIKGMLNKAGGKKKGKSEKSSKKAENKKEDGSGKKGGFELGDGKKGKNDDGWSKKAGDNFHGGKPQHHQQQQQALSEMKANHKGGGGGGGRNMEMMGQMGGFPAVAGMPAMNGGRFPGAGQGNPYSQQQQYMAQMMMMNQMNQQREHGHEAAYHPLAYARPQPPTHMGYGGPPPMGYGAPPPMPMGYGAPAAATGEYAHMFSDENTDSCSIM